MLRFIAVFRLFPVLDGFAMLGLCCARRCASADPCGAALR
ncbi:hypothetical protein ABIE28_000343 [Devosia sp. 2618]